MNRKFLSFGIIFICIFSLIQFSQISNVEAKKIQTCSEYYEELIRSGWIVIEETETDVLLEKDGVRKHVYLLNDISTYIINNIDSQAYEGESGTINNFDGATTEFTSANYLAIDGDDVNYVLDYTGLDNRYQFHRFDTTISEALEDVTQVDITIKGWGGTEADSTIGYFLYVDESATWTLKTSHTTASKDTLTQQYIENFANIIVDSHIHWGVRSPKQVAKWGRVISYYGEVVVTYSVGADPVNDSLTFENPYATNQAVGDNDGTYSHARYWHFQAKVTDDDGATDLKTVDLKLETSNGVDDIVLRWTQATDTFSEVTDTNNWIADLTVNSASGVVGNQTTLDFKFKISNSFTTMSTDYDMKLLSTDDADATDTDTYANIYEVIAISLGVTLSEATLAYGSADAGTTTASQNVTITNSSNIYVKASVKFSTFTDTESNTMNVYTGGEPRCYFKFNEDNGVAWSDIQAWNTYYEHKDDLNFAGGSNTVLLYVTYTHPLSGHSKNQYTSTLTVGVAIT